MSKCINCKKFLSCKHTDTEQNCTDTEQKCTEYEYRSEVKEMIKEIDKRAEGHSERYREDVIENIQNGVLEIEEKGDK